MVLSADHQPFDSNRRQPAAGPPGRRRSPTAELQRTELDMLGYFNQQHLRGREQDSRLESRIKSFETAARMQMAAPDVFDVNQESKATLGMYGIDPGNTAGFAWQ